MDKVMDGLRVAVLATDVSSRNGEADEKAHP